MLAFLHPAEPMNITVGRGAPSSGREVALIDTGAPPSLQVVKGSIEKHGFAVADIDHSFVTHCEHPDHAEAFSHCYLALDR
jgi:hypothetical protein